MPRFLYTVALAAIGFWILTGKLFFGARPDSAGTIIQFILLLGGAVALTVSIASFVLKLKKNPEFTNKRHMYRKSLKWGFFVGSFVSIFLGLRAFDIATNLNLALLGLSYAMIFLQFRRSR